MPQLLIKVQNKVAKPLNDFIVCGNSDYTVKFCFDKEWDSQPIKTARFIWNNQYQDVVFEGDTCPMPVIENATTLGVGVYAGSLQTTTPAIIHCTKSVLCGLGCPSDPPEDVYNQIIELLNEDISALEEKHDKDIEAIDKRINNLIKLEEGSTTGDAELIDIRFGADEKTYDTAGEAVRTQFSNVKTMIYNRNHGTLSFQENVVFDPSTFTITFPAGYMRYISSNYREVNAQTLNLTEVPTSYNAWDLFYSLDNQNIYARHWQASTNSTDVYIGSVYNNHIYLNGVSDKYITVVGDLKKDKVGFVTIQQNITFDPVNFTVTFPLGYIRYETDKLISIQAQTLNLTDVTTAYNAWDLYYSIADQNFYARYWQSMEATSDIYVGSVWNRHIYINGVSDKYITITNEYDTRRMGLVTIAGKVIYDVATKILTIPVGYVKYSTNANIPAPEKIIDLNEVTTTDGAWNIYFNTTNGYYATAWKAGVNNGDIFVGSVFNDNVSINGVTADNLYIKKKTVCFFGDSITAGVHSSSPYHANMSSLNIKALNYGIGGTGFVLTYTGNGGLTGNGCEGQGSVIAQTGNNTIKEVMESVGDFSYCSIFAGTNDFGGNVDLETFKIAVEDTLDYALSITPYVVCSTPIRRNMTTNGIGKTLEEYSEIVKECCKARAIPCFDAYNNSCLNPMIEQNNKTYFSDGLHLNNNGSIRFARFYKEWVQKITG